MGAAVGCSAKAGEAEAPGFAFQLCTWLSPAASPGPSLPAGDGGDEAVRSLGVGRQRGDTCEHRARWFAPACERSDLGKEGAGSGLNPRSVFQPCKVVLGQPKVERRDLYCSRMNKAPTLGMMHLIFSGVGSLRDL